MALPFATRNLRHDGGQYLEILLGQIETTNATLTGFALSTGHLNGNVEKGR